MSNDAGAPSDKGAGGAAPDMADIRRFISEEVGKAVHARSSRVEEKLAEIVTGEIGKLTSTLKPPAEDKKSDAADEKPTLKALQDQIAALNKGIAEERKARAEAEKAAERTRADSDLRSHFARHLNGDNARHIDPYLKFHRDEFLLKDGTLVRKVTGSYGDEEYVPVAKAVDDMFAGDLKFLVQQSKAAQMPRVGGGTGQPWTPPKNAAPHGISPMEAEIFEAMGKDRPELAQEMYKQALAAAEARGTQK